MSNSAVVDDITIPIIDISSLMLPLYDENMINTANLIDQALKTFGLFIAINHNSIITVKEAMDTSNLLFQLKLESKMEVKMDDITFARGYIPEGRESGLIDKYYEPKEGIVSDYNIKYKYHTNAIINTKRLQLWLKS